MKNMGKIYIACLFIFGPFSFYSCSAPQFKPTYFKQGNIVQEDTFKNDFQRVQIQRILTHYKHWWQEDPQGNILIRRSLANNSDLVFNYTNKSLDSVWITKHLEIKP